MGDQTTETSLDTKLTLLKKIELFSNLHKPALKKIADLLEDMEYQKGHYVFKKGDEGDAVFIITKGSVSVKDEDLVLSTLKEGDVFGEYALIDNKSRSASIFAEETLKILRLDRNSFTKLLIENKEIQKGLLHLFVNRLREHDVLEKKLADQTMQIIKQKETLEELNEEKNHLMGIIAHDLRNPLASTLSLAQLLQSESESFSEDHVICINGIIKALNRMCDMVDRILDVKTLEAKREQITLEKVDISELIKQAHDGLKSKIEKKKLKAYLNLNNIYANVDRQYLLQVIENLLSNAIKFSSPGKSIFINLWVHGGKVHIGIKDEGPGISMEDQKKLFHKFQLLSARPTAGESSTGLGLSIVKKYTELMNGNVWCESEPGKGAKFVVTFKKGM
jgi:signal transduction histidine kinase